VDSRLVYFIEAIGLDMIKIGIAADVGLRLSNLQTSSPVPLKLLGTMPGGKEMEGILHGMLAGQRVRGEWFRRCPKIEQYLEGCNKPYVPDADEQKVIARDKRYASYRMRKANYNGALRGVPRAPRSPA
jgi:hypothetical protein